jgi:hypothetical protein
MKALPHRGPVRDRHRIPVLIAGLLARSTRARRKAAPKGVLCVLVFSSILIEVCHVVRDVR